MNIHIDKNLYNILSSSTIFKCMIGSYMYGINDEYSDIDYLHIYVPTIAEQNSFTYTHHQYQYKEDNIDYIFVDIFSFIRNCLIGDSTINFEIIWLDEMKTSNISFLYDMREKFINYKILRSYLGLARRDLIMLSKEKTIREKNKKLIHIIRGYNFAYSIFNNNFEPKITGKLLEEINIVKSYTSDKDRHFHAEKYKQLISDFRDELNLLFDNRNTNFPRYMKTEDQKMLDNYLSELINSDIWKKHLNKDFDMTYLYVINENDLIY